MRTKRTTGDPALRRNAPRKARRRPPVQRPRCLRAPPLRVNSILAWADAYHGHRGKWPTRDSGPIPECSWTTWHQVDRALQDGFRGLPGGSTLPRFLAKHRGARNQGDLPRLIVRQILAWADEHQARTGKWPNEYSGRVGAAPGERWWNISAALRDGGRGWPGGSSLARLLTEQRGVRNRGHLPRLSVRQILRWADAHRARNGRWPTAQSGLIQGTNGETWSGINQGLIRGARGLLGHTTLAELLARHRGYRNTRNLPPLSVKQVLRWALQYLAEHQRWPTNKSGPVLGTSETWGRIDDALRRGFRGLPAGSSLARLRKQHGIG